MTGKQKWVAAVVGAVLVAVVILVAGRDRASTPATAPAPRSTTSPAPVAPLTGPALAAKIDNVPAARPQTGLGSAEVVYVEPVEGGLTRLLAVYTGTPPAVIGPVRSARRTDIELLGQYGTPVLAYSGAAPELLPSVHAANLVNASPEEAAAYYRDPGRPAPHNLYVRTSRLPDGARAPTTAPLRFGPAPAAGVPTATYRVSYPQASFAFTWSAGDGRWLVSMNGTPVVDTGSGLVRAATVVWQRVPVTSTEPGEDSRAGGSPVAHTVGSGPAVVLRDGQSFTGGWSRPAERAPTTFRTEGGQELPLAAGPVWVLLTPA